MATAAAFASATPTSSRAASSSSINLVSPRGPAIPDPTGAPISRDDTHDRRHEYEAYAIPVRDVRDGQAILQNNHAPDYINLRSRREGKGKAKETDFDAPTEVESRPDRGSRTRRSSRRRASSSLTRGLVELGWVDGLDDARRRLEKRLPMAEGYPSCNYVGNGILSCYPESNTTIVQGNYSKFIWNAQYPTFIGAGDVDIYLYNGDTEEIATSWLGVQNARGMIGITPDDEWWPQESASEWFNSDRNRTIPYFFVIVDGGSELTGGETHQSTFSVIQTAAPSSLSSTLAILTASSLSSASSVSAASASASSLSSQLSASSALSSSASASRATNANGELQPSSSGGGGPAIPKWAIAIIVILGFFALVAGAFAIVFCLGRARKRRRQDAAAAAAAGGIAGTEEEERQALGGGGGGHGGGAGTEDGFSNSDASREPFLGSSPATSGRGPSSLAPAVLGASGVALGGIVGAGGTKRDEAGTDSEDEKQGGLDRNDAARMAEAFRAALRRPEFPHNGGTESSGESGAGVLSSTTSNGANRDAREGTRTADAGRDDVGGEEEPEGRSRELIEEELRSEGMSMRDVAGGGGKRWG